MGKRLLSSIAAMLENIVYFELQREGYEIYVGKNETKEVGFATMQRDERVYVQAWRRNLTVSLQIYSKYKTIMRTIN